MKIAYLGPAGTFSEKAALEAGDQQSTYLPMASMPAVITAVETRAVDLGILPIENSLEGAVSVTLDVLIHETRLRICREIVIPIRHMLVAKPDVQLDTVEVLYTHQQPLAQSRRFIERCLPNVPTVAALSTAAALVEALADERRAAALTTLHAAERAQANILAYDVQDNNNNRTRFVVLAPEDAAPTGDDKTSLMFTAKINRAGALYEALAIFAQANINLSKIESRPAKAELGDYVFLVDIDGHRHEPAVAEALQKLAQIAGTVKIFGSYPKFRT